MYSQCAGQSEYDPFAEWMSKRGNLVFQREPNFRTPAHEGLTAHYTNERGHFTCCRGPGRSVPLRVIPLSSPADGQSFRPGRWPLTHIIADNFRQWIKIIYITCQRLCTPCQVKSIESSFRSERMVLIKGCISYRLNLVFDTFSWVLFCFTESILRPSVYVQV